ncbi:WG repeat-containing protein [Mucilaginibacter sp. HD30]
MREANLILLIVICICLSACTQKKDTWVAFYNKDTTLVGFKDKQGQIKIPPKFTTYGAAEKFDNIIAVSEFKKPKDANYYLTKNGRIVGRDSLYYFDSFPDCECEGFIRFIDYKSLKMGMFNANGDIAIPAIYNYLSPVRNGLIMALTGAKRVYPKDPNEEHFDPWEGGKEILINTTNKVIIRNFPYDADIDFYSVIVSEEPNPSTVRKNFKADKTKYYSFISFEKEFKAWLKNTLLNNITLKNLLANSHSTIQVERDADRQALPKEKFLKSSFNLLKSKLSRLKVTTNFDVYNEGLNPYIYGGNEFEEYFDNCGMSKDWLYPVMEVIVTGKDNAVQESFEFLRSKTGYKLIGVSF